MPGVNAGLPLKTKEIEFSNIGTGKRASGEMKELVDISAIQFGLAITLAAITGL